MVDAAATGERADEVDAFSPVPMRDRPIRDRPIEDRPIDDTPTDDIEALSYEAARDQLIGVVDELERGGTTLEQSLALWERGEALATRCETWLTGARARLDAARTAES